AALREIIATGPSLLKARAAWLGGAEIGSRATNHLRTAWVVPRWLKSSEQHG
ncbi:MAG: hypothetical protein QOE55_998, partial [Acidobacteriaceae bacterium]|nr:hypothetical protein [Acidobacteriaceae bacterium]